MKEQDKKEYKDEIQRRLQDRRDFKGFKEEGKSNWIKRIIKYEEVKEDRDYFKGEKERVDDLVIKRLNRIDSQIDAILEVLKDINTRLPLETNRNASNLHKKTKVDKSIEEDAKVENKANKRGRKKKEK